MIKDILLPEISENIDEAEVVQVRVTVGEVIEADQPVAECETQKAVFEIPSPDAGKITEILIREGDTVKVGQALAKIDTEVADAHAEKSEMPFEHAQEHSVSEKETASVSEAKPPLPSTPPPELPPSSDTKEPGISKTPPPASPATRRFAREIGVDIHRVTGSGPGARISKEDIRAHAKRLLQGGVSKTETGIPVPRIPDLSRWGPVRTEPMSKVRIFTAQAMTEAWLTVPRVTQNDKADVTQMERSRKELAPQIREAGGKLTVTAILVKIAAAALKKFPEFNAVPDMANQQIIYRDYVNISVAVDTDRGLLVPVMKNADQKSLLELSIELTEIAEKARSKKIMPDMLEGGCFSISNLGGFGVGHFTPIVSGPQTALLGVGRSREEAVFMEGQWLPRLMLPLSLSYDHRLIDGANAARFVRWIVRMLENPFALALEGGL